MPHDRESELGALWVKQGQRGEYMTGVLKIDGRDIKVICFPNDRKTSEKHPDWRILKSQPRSEREE